MTGLCVEQFSSLVELIYSAATDAVHWDSVTEALTKTLHARYGAIFGFNPRTSSVLHGSGWGLPTEVMSAYQAKYAALDIRMPAALRAAPGSALTDESLIDRRVYLSSAIYNEFLRPLSLERLLAVLPYNSAGRQVIVSVNRPDGSGAFDAEERRFLERLVPHLQRALLISEKMAQCATARLMADELMTRARHGVLFLGPGGAIVGANEVAENLLKSKSAIRSVDGRLCASVRHLNDELQRAIGAAEKVARLGIGAAPDVVTLNANDADVLYFIVAPLGARASRMTRDAPVSAAFLFPGSLRPNVEARHLRRVYGLTPSEARIAALLVAGFSTAEAAGHLSVTIETARTHIKRVLAKMQCETQAAVVRKVLLGPVPTISSAAEM